MTFEAWRTLVKAVYQGGEPTHAAQMRLVADGARGVLVRDIEGDLPLSKSYLNSFREGKVKLAGTRIVDSIAAVIIEVSGLMPIEADTAAATAILENAITTAYDDVNGAADKWDAHLLEAAHELQVQVPFFHVRQTTTYLVDTAGVTNEGFISRVALPATARIQQVTYGHYYAALESDTTYVAEDRVVSNGRVYEVVTGGTVTAYEVGVGLVSADGENETLGDMVFKYYDGERDWPVREMEWSVRNRLKAGDFSGGPVYCFPPESDEIWFFPILDATHRFDLDWVGIAATFADVDEVTFDQTAAEAAAHYIRSMMLATELDDAKNAAVSMSLFQRAVRKAVLDNEERDTGSPTQTRPYDYRRCAHAWGACCPPIVVT